MSLTETDRHDAKLIVEWVLGVALEPRVAVPVGGADFDLLEDGRRTGAVVVARSHRSPHLRAWGSVRRLSWEASGLRSWLVRLGPVSRSGPDERMIVGLLAELELAGGAGFERADQVRVAALRAAGVRLSPAERVLEDLAVFGVVGAEPDQGTGCRMTVVAKVPESTDTSVDAVNEAVETEAWRADNRGRLARTDAEDRHLFVWLSPTDVAARAAMDADEVPAPPLLVPETTALWVARRPAADSDLVADRVWQTNPLGQWEALGSVARWCLAIPASRG